MLGFLEISQYISLFIGFKNYNRVIGLVVFSDLGFFFFLCGYECGGFEEKKSFLGLIYNCFREI